MSVSFRVESVDETDEGITVGIDAYQEPFPITVVFEKFWGNPKIKLKEIIVREKHRKPKDLRISKWLKSLLKRRARAVMNSRERRRKIILFQRNPRRLFR